MICSRILSSGDSRWAVCGYIRLIINLIEFYNRRKHFILLVGTQRILILFNCILLIIFLLTMQAPWQSRGQGEREAGGHISPLIFLKVRCQVVITGNSLLCHSPKHRKLIWPRHCQNLVGGPALGILIF